MTKTSFRKLLPLLLHLVTSTAFQPPSLNVVLRKNKIYTTPKRITSTSAITTTSLYSKKPKGVYTRPSAAIERGSGFYIPGLEGSRIRILFGCLVLVLNYVNGLGSGSDVAGTSSLAVSKGVTVFYGLLLVLLGAVELGKEAGFVTSSSVSSSPNEPSRMDLSRAVSSSLSGKTVEGLNWAGASYISLTAANYFAVIKNDGVIFRLGDASILSSPNDDDGDAARNCKETVWASRGGRVSIPSDHPGVGVVPEGSRRCVLLQSFKCQKEEECCMVVGSGDVLQAFTKNDLKWLGSLANYVANLEL